MNRLCLTLLLSLMAISAVAAPFTYQGRLSADALDANGDFDFELRLFDAESNGSQVGPMRAFAAVPVVDGLFMLEPDFGDPGFGRGELWLEVSVRESNSGDAFSPLEPRNRVGAAPLAVRALSAPPSMPGQIEALLMARTTVPFALHHAADRHVCDPGIDIVLQAADGNRYGLTALYAREGLSRVPDIWVVFDTAAAHSASQFLDQFSRIDLTDASGTTYLAGLGIEFHVDDSRDGLRRHALRIRPDWAGMLLSRDYAIYQSLSVPDVASSVLAQSGLAASQSLAGFYPTREYIVQYDESSLDFIHRLLGEVGIFYLFSHGADSTSATLTDTASSLTGSVVLDYLGPDARSTGSPYLSGFSSSARVYTGVATSRAYNPDQPSPILESVVTTDGQSGEDYRFLGDVTSIGELTTRNQARADAIEAAARTISGTSNATALRSGTRLTVNDADAVFDGEYIVTTATHLAVRSSGRTTCSQYANSFTAVPSSAPLLPASTPAKPVPGMLRGVVVGPAGEPIHTDGEGRVKVQFHWDRAGNLDENSSAFLRTVAPLDQSTFAIPEVGNEVLVGFIQGDPDRPVVLGRLFNGND